MLTGQDNDSAAFAQPMIDPDGVRFGRLKLFAESPLHYLANVQSSASHLSKGTAVHSLLLGGKRVTFYDKVTANGSSAPRRGAEWEAFKAANDGATILSRSEYDVSNRIADAVRANGMAMELLKDCIPEDTLHFDYLGLPCRTTPDWRAKNGSHFGELKTAKSSKPSRFAAQSLWMYYHAQMAWHREGMKRMGLWKDVKPGPYIIAVCSAPPFPVTIFKMTDTAMEAGEKLIRGWFEQLKTCIASRQFPAYSQAVVDLDVPSSEELVFANGESESVDVDF